MRPPSFFAVAACIFSLALMSVAASAVQATGDDHPKFPPGEGRELTIKVCSQCHEAEILADLELDEEGWKSTVSQMASMGATATEAELDQIVKYLTKAFPLPAK